MIKPVIVRPIILMVWIAMVCGWFGRLFWVLDLTNHFIAQYFVICSLCVFWTLVRRQWKWLGVAIATAAILIIRIAPYYLPSELVEDSKPSLRLISCNLLTSNPQKASVIQFLEKTGADVILLMEMDRKWQEATKPLQAHYPFGGYYPREDNFGIALLSKLPISDLEVKSFDDAHLPSVTGNVDWSGRELRIIGTHPLPPMSAINAAFRHQHFSRLAEVARHSDLPTVICGDLNCTSWSPHFHLLLTESKLRDSRQGKGIQPSWPSSLLVGRIPIDHVLVSKEIQVKSRKLGPFIGSDHLPVIVDLSFDR